MNAKKIVYQVERWQTSDSLKSLRCKVKDCRALLVSKALSPTTVTLVCPKCGKKYKVPDFVLEVYWKEIDSFRKMIEDEQQGGVRE